MDHTIEELTEAHRQISSTIHKLNGVVETLEAKPDPVRYKSQITLAKRRAAAFTLALELVEGELNKEI